MISYVTAQVNSKRRLRPTDLISFAWESTNQEQAQQQQEPTLTMEDVERIKKAAKEREKLLKEKGII